MDIEHLSKSQIVLLTLLISFVTSIATGIVTVSLMQQAPPAIAQTVNRIVQETVQQVMPASQSASVGKMIVTEQKTVIVKESDMISQAVARISPSLVRLYSGSGDTSAFIGLGIVLDASGTILTDSDVLGQNADATVTFSNGTSLRAFVRERDVQTGFAYLTVATSSLVATPTFTPAAIAGGHAVLGQSVVALSGKTTPRIASGLVVSIVASDSGKAAPQVIETDISTDSILDGSPLIDTEGAVVGISTGLARASSPSGFIAASALIKAPAPSQ